MGSRELDGRETKAGLPVARSCPVGGDVGPVGDWHWIDGDGDGCRDGRYRLIDPDGREVLSFGPHVEVAGIRCEIAEALNALATLRREHERAVAALQECVEELEAYAETEHLRSSTAYREPSSVEEARRVIDQAQRDVG